MSQGSTTTTSQPVNASASQDGGARRLRPEGTVLAGWTVSAVVMLFNLIDGLAKMFHTGSSVEGTVSLGFPEKYLFAIGLTLIVCSVVYMVPFTSLVGAVLLTGYLGGATAIQVRVESMNFLFALFLGILVWVGLLLRDGRLRAFVRESLLG